MNVIDFKKTRCQHCYKCVRNCAIKAIQIKDGQACILPEECILCGHCLEVCPQNAKTVHSECKDVKGFLREEIPVVASVAPSAAVLFGEDGGNRIVSALKKLGFAAVRETSEGAAYVTEEYRKRIERGENRNWITTCCPSAVELVEKQYPSQIPALLPVVSPMTAHARRIRQEWDGPVRIVFFGPCIAKKREAKVVGDVDGVLTFQELEEWLEEEGISLENCKPEPYSNEDPKANRLYPAGGGILAALQAAGTEFGAYRKLKVDGLQACMELLADMEAGRIQNCVIEMSVCENSCLNGPGAPKRKPSIYQMQADLQERVSVTAVGKDWFVGEKGWDAGREFRDRSVEVPQPSEDEIRRILREMGKNSPEDELNCGACGYPSCRAKAAAVYQGKAEIEMCLPYMHDKARSLANVVMESTPNAVLLIAPDLRIREASRSARKLFAPDGGPVVGRKLSEFLPAGEVEQVFRTRTDIHNEKRNYPEFGKIVLETMVYVDKMEMVLAIFVDITEKEARERHDRELRMEMVAVAQKVIDKQMMVAQEIAGLLGETTAETKVTLSKLRDSILFEEEE